MAEAIPWDELPLTIGEEDPRWISYMYQYSHVGCPGYHYEDNCAAPWDCASKGRCRISYEKARKYRIGEGWNEREEKEVSLQEMRKAVRDK